MRTKRLLMIDRERVRRERERVVTTIVERRGVCPMADDFLMDFLIDRVSSDTCHEV
jgi:hypothetical protein